MYCQMDLKDHSEWVNLPIALFFVIDIASAVSKYENDKFSTM